MSWVILDAMENQVYLDNELSSFFNSRKEEVFYFQLKNKRVLACRACGSCGFKSPGRCIFDDDVHEILWAIARADKIIMLTPVRFGGYNSCLKKVVDKFALLVLPSYTVKQGHLLHPLRYGKKDLIAIDYLDHDSKQKEESFKRLVEHNALNMQSSYKAFIIRKEEVIKDILLEILKGGRLNAE